ncbi:GGDEF domain-containing protein [Hoeflea sp.]|uniref:GGDEF domain-containing protein n=1 Tax=Hoeflea sp. TaxID=1940281 RepID=UPI003BB20F3C
MNQHIAAEKSVGIRVATAMLQMGIEGLPRNYELVYEAYSGVNAELTKEFIAIGRVKSQRALDELGRKYLPHHHEETVLSKTSDRMRLQMSTFMTLLEEEKSSLTDYGRIIDQASRSISVDGEIDRDKLVNSIRQLSEATEQQASKSVAMAVEARQQAASLDEVRSDIDTFGKMKFVDQLTGLANRRAFNKAISRIYANAELPMMCGLGLAEIDSIKQLVSAGEGSDTGSNDRFIRHVGSLLHAANRNGEFVARLDRDRFAFLINSSEEVEIMRVIDALRLGVSSKPLISPKNGRSLGNATLSVGVAMSTLADNAAQLMDFAEKALAVSVRDGGNRATLYSGNAQPGANRDWMIYRP